MVTSFDEAVSVLFVLMLPSSSFTSDPSSGTYSAAAFDTSSSAVSVISSDTSSAALSTTVSGAGTAAPASFLLHATADSITAADIPIAINLSFNFFLSSYCHTFVVTSLTTILTNRAVLRHLFPLLKCISQIPHLLYCILI